MITMKGTTHSQDNVVNGHTKIQPAQMATPPIRGIGSACNER